MQTGRLSSDHTLFTYEHARENSNDKRQQDKGRKMEYFWGNGEIPLISSEIKPPLRVD